MFERTIIVTYGSPLPSLFVLVVFLGQCTQKQDGTGEYMSTLERISSKMEMYGRGTLARFTVVSACTNLWKQKVQDWYEHNKVSAKSWDSICLTSHQNFVDFAQNVDKVGVVYFSNFPIMMNRSVHWIKIPCMLAVLRNPLVSYAMWTDADSLFIKYVSLNALIPDRFSSMRFLNPVGSHFWTSHFVMRANSLSEDILKKAWEYFPTPGPFFLHEQGALALAIGCNSVFCSNMTQLISGIDPRFNAGPWIREPDLLNKSTVIVSFTGLIPALRDLWMRFYACKRKSFRHELFLIAELQNLWHEQQAAMDVSVDQNLLLRSAHNLFTNISRRCSLLRGGGTVTATVPDGRPAPLGALACVRGFRAAQEARLRALSARRLLDASALKARG